MSTTPDTHKTITIAEHALLVTLATETERQIEQKFKHRGFGQCKKWEKKLLHLAKLALGKPSPFKPKDFERNDPYAPATY